MSSSNYLNKALVLLKEADSATSDVQQKIKKNKLALDYLQMAFKCLLSLHLIFFLVFIYIFFFIIFI
jgi:hypothetical protein